MVWMQIIVMLLIISVLIWMYIINIGNKSKEIMKIMEDGKCPKCSNIELDIDKQGNGCSGTDTWIVKCSKCGLNESYTVPNNGSCGL